MNRMQRHWVEFDRLQDHEVARLLRWCRTCCFRQWNTHTDGHTNFRFMFESEMDARRFVWTFDNYFNPIPPTPTHWDNGPMH